MNKTLTISIAAYNVGRYIKETLNSLVLKDYMDQYEVFIVDDGSTDNLKEVVDPFIKLYPKTFFLCQKENGGYGSTINWSIKHANGKFFKVLDGDDTIESEGLAELLDILNNTNADAIVSQAIRKFPDGQTKKIYPFIDGLAEQKLYSIPDCKDYADVAVWGYTFRTSVIRDGWIELPLHSFYTDRLFVLHTLANVKNIQYQKSVVYQYRVGLDEQSTSVKSIRKHYKEAVVVDLDSIDWFAQNINKSCLSYQYICNRLGLNFAYTYCMFLDLPINNTNLNELKNFALTVKNKNHEAYNFAVSKATRVKIVEKTSYIGYYFWPFLRFFRNRLGKF